MESIPFVLVRTRKGETKREDIYTELRECSAIHMYGFHAHCMMERYTELVELEKGCTYEVEVRHPQVVLRCET